MLIFNEDATEAFSTSKAHGFHDTITGEFQIPMRLLLMISEVTEAFEDYRSTPTGSEAMSDHFVEELADVYIRLGDLVAFPQIGVERFEQIVKRKMETNKNRPYRHGGKRC